MKASNAPGTLKPILFNTEMVRAILAGKKTCTRRIAKSEKPPFVVGDILYVRETWCINTFGTHYRADWPNGACPEMDCDDQWHPSIHMGKDIARIFLRVKSVERGPLRGMEVADFQKEGVKPQNRPGGCKCAWAQEGCMERPCENRDAYERWRYMTSFRNPELFQRAVDMEHNAADSLTSIKGLGRKWSWESYHDEFIEAQELEKAQLTFDDLFPEAPGGCLCGAPCGCYDG